MASVESQASISGPRRAGYWVKVGLRYLLAAVGSVSALIALLRWYRVPGNPEAAVSRLVASAVVVVACLAATATMIHLALDYRRRYRQQRHKGLVRDLYNDRNHLIEHYPDVIGDATRCLRVLGISLHTLLTHSSFEQAVRTALAQNSELQISLVFLKPYSLSVRLREQVEKRPAGRISVDCLSNYERAMGVKSRLGSDAARFHVYQVDALPPGFMLQRDDEVYFEPYLAGEPGRTFPVFVMGRNAYNEQAFRKFTDHIDALIDQAIESHGPTSCPRAFVTSFGEREQRQGLRSAVFLDRDGVLVEDTGYISSPDKLRLLPGVVDAVRQLQEAFRIVIVTNQSGVARGFFSEPDLLEIHSRLLAMLEDGGAFVDAVYYCPHHPDVGIAGYKVDCECRKPKTGMYEAARDRFGLNLAESITVGDAERDVQAGKAAGMRTILISRENGGMRSGGADGVAQGLADVPGMLPSLGRPKTDKEGERAS